jgi:hypothetical protein
VTQSSIWVNDIRGVSEKFGEWYQKKKNKTGDTKKLTVLVFKIIAILHNTLLAHPQCSIGCSLIERLSESSLMLAMPKHVGDTIHN